MKLFCTTSAIALSAMLLASNAANAAIEITPAEFSGFETIVTFAGNSIAGATSYTSPENVTFALTGNAPNLGINADISAGRTGPGETNALDGFTPDPRSNYQDLVISFNAGVSRVGLDVRVNPGDNLLDFVLLLNGNVVDQIQILGDALGVPGNPPFQFFGFESTLLFDTVQMNVPANVNGAYVIDNVRFEDGTVPEPVSILVWGSLASIAGAIAYRRNRLS